MREAEVSVLEKSDRGGREEVVAVATESPRMEDLQVGETQTLKIKKKTCRGEKHKSSKKLKRNPQTLKKKIEMNLQVGQTQKLKIKKKPAGGRNTKIKH